MSDVLVNRNKAIADPAKSRSRSNKRRFALAGLAIAFGLGMTWYGVHWWTVGRFIESTDDAYVGGDVTVIAPQVPGFITEVAVTDNQPVRAGDLLVRLDDRTYRAALAKAEAAVAGEQATLANIEARRQVQQSLIAEARADVAAAQAEIIRSREDLIRYRQLAAASVASVQTRQKAEAADTKAIAAGEQTRAAFGAAEGQLAILDTQKRQTEAALASASAERDMARLNLGYTELRAPVDGTIGNRGARLGAFAAAGSQILSVVPSQGLWIDANFKENQLAHLRPGMPATIEADALPGESFRGRVVSLAPATGAVFSVLPPENATGNFTKIVQRVPVRIALDGDASRLGRLRPGLSVSVAVDARGDTP
jgi:membrane fusion protein (multidrug efflux system)